MNDILLYVVILIPALVLMVGAVMLLIPMLVGAPFLRSDTATRKVMLACANITEGELVIDLGSGDGILVVESAKRGARAIGYEINPLLVARSKQLIKKSGLLDASIRQKSLWDADVSQADVILLFGISHIMPRLEKKLRAELKSGARVVSQTFFFPHWEPTRTEGRVRLYVQE